MKILLVHNYLRPPSGENTVFEQERDLLRSKGDVVITYTRHNSEIGGMRTAKKSLIPIRAFWSSEAFNDIVRTIKNEKPDIAHFHNIFPLISPSAYHACKSHNIPVIQTLHNYRIVCPGAFLFRENAVCTECSGMHFLPGIKHGCYRNSRVFTAGIAGIVLFHKLIRTWQESVDLYLALSEFALERYKEMGFPSINYFVKPNFLQNPIEPEYTDDGYGIYIGRLGEEKGIDCLLSALSNCPTINFKIVGDGPLREHLKDIISDLGLHNVEYLGARAHAQCMQILLKSRFFVLPSQCYEGIPMVLLEAMSAGKPSIVSDVGVLPMMVKNGVDGLVFQPGASAALAEKITWLTGHAEDAREMGRKARQAFEQNYMKEKNYQILIDAYRKAIEINHFKKKKY